MCVHHTYIIKENEGRMKEAQELTQWIKERGPQATQPSEQQESERMWLLRAVGRQGGMEGVRVGVRDSDWRKGSPGGK